MKNYLLLIIILGSLNSSWSQSKKEEQINKIKGFDTQFKSLVEKDSLELEVLKNYQAELVATQNNALIDSIKISNDKRNTYKAKLDTIYGSFTHYSWVYKDNGELSQKEIDSLFTHHDYTVTSSTKTVQETTKETEIYTYYGEKKVIKEDIFANKTSDEAKVVTEILAENSENYLGDITIPKENQKLFFYNEKRDSIIGEYLFNKIELEIRDGNFADIRVYVEYKGNIHTFENQIGVSLLRYSSRAKDNYLSYKQTTINNESFTLDEMRNFNIRLGDVMVYNYEMGSHYIPHNLVLKLPVNDVSNDKTNEGNPATYRIKQKTDLDKIVELRTYTDFLALLGESNNGLVQIEGKAKFYVFPFPRQICSTGMQVQFLPTISPYVNYSRFDDDVRYVSLTTDSLSQNKVTSPLELVEKRYLTMGLEANLFQVEHKDFPVSANLYGFVNYQLSETNLGNDSIPDVQNIKAVSFGGGLELSSKRFRNFGFNYKLDFSWYDYKNNNTINMLTMPDRLLPVYRNQAEVYYHPANKPNSALFVRLITYNNSSSKNNEAFYQFQVGYKFSIGTRTINN